MCHLAMPALHSAHAESISLIKQAKAGMRAKAREIMWAQVAQVAHVAHVLVLFFAKAFTKLVKED